MGTPLPPKDPFEDTAPDPISDLTPLSDGGGSLQSQRQSGSPVWLTVVVKHLIPRIGAYALATPLAIKLPTLIGLAIESGSVWPVVIAALIIVAVGAPAALRDITELVRAYRSTPTPPSPKD